MLYLAYGSNMSSRRLRARTPGIQRLGVTQLMGYRLMFHKIGHLDSTGKCDALYTGNADDYLFGVLYAITALEKRKLDTIEGLGNGYAEQQVTVPTGPNETGHASIYIATHIDPDLKPYHWYKAHVLAGARENYLPPEYTRRIAATESISDPDVQRSQIELAIYNDSNDVTGSGATDVPSILKQI